MGGIFILKELNIYDIYVIIYATFLNYYVII